MCKETQYQQLMCLQSAEEREVEANARAKQACARSAVLEGRLALNQKTFNVCCLWVSKAFLASYCI